MEIKFVPFFDEFTVFIISLGKDDMSRCVNGDHLRDHGAISPCPLPIASGDKNAIQHPFRLQIPPRFLARELLIRRRSTRTVDQDFHPSFVNPIDDFFSTLLFFAATAPDLLRVANELLESLFETLCFRP